MSSPLESLLCAGVLITLLIAFFILAHRWEKWAKEHPPWKIAVLARFWVS